MANKQDRDTKPHKEKPLVTDKEELARLEASNASMQYNDAQNTIADFIINEKSFKLRPSLIFKLHHTAMENIIRDAGQYRNNSIDEITGSEHNPPEAHLCPSLVEEMCDYINENKSAHTFLELSAYALWRLNWIHPFSNGNGRTSRMVAHIILSIMMKQLLAGKTIAEQIAENKEPYYNALEQADEAFKNNETIDISALAELMQTMLMKQIKQVQQIATGLTKNPEERSFH